MGGMNSLGGMQGVVQRASREARPPAHESHAAADDSRRVHVDQAAGRVRRVMRLYHVPTNTVIDILSGPRRAPLQWYTLSLYLMCRLLSYTAANPMPRRHHTCIYMHAMNLWACVHVYTCTNNIGTRPSPAAFTRACQPGMG